MVVLLLLMVPAAYTVSITANVVCAIGVDLPVNNLPPPSYNMTGPPGSYVQTLLSENGFVYLPRLVPPYFVINGDTLNYSNARLGIVWRINNEDTDTSQNAIPIRWEVGEYEPPNGTTAAEVIPVPFGFGSPTDTSVPAAQSRWIFSRTNSSHKLYGNAEVGCVSANDCATRVPLDPPDASLPTANIIYAEFDANSTSLPECECYVNVPCSRGAFQFLTARTVDVSTLPAPPAPAPQDPNITLVPIFANCSTFPEICNGLDDNCDGIVDNVPGVNISCVSNFAGGLCALFPGILKCNATTNTLECFGMVLPTEELCDFLDHDCDGVVGNVPSRGQPCGSDEGVCTKGTWECAGSDLLPSCVGGVSALASEICGNGLDDDCNGLIDDGCPRNSTVASPGGSSSSSPSAPSSSSSPSPSTTTITSPDSTVGDIFNSLLKTLFGIDFSNFSVDWAALFLIVCILCVLVVTCIISIDRHDSVRVQLTIKRGRRSERLASVKVD